MSLRNLPPPRRLRAKARHQLSELAEFLATLSYGRAQSLPADKLPESRLPAWLLPRPNDPPARRAWAIASSPRLASIDAAQLLLNEASRLVDLFPIPALTHASLALAIAARAAAQSRSSRVTFAIGARAALAAAQALQQLGDEAESLLALTVAETAAAVAPRNPTLLGQLHLAQACQSNALRRLDAAGEQIEQAVLCFGEARQWAEAGKALLALGWLHLHRGEPGVVAYLITSGAAYSSPLADPEQNGRPFLLLGWAAARAGCWSVARGLLEEAARLSGGLFPVAEQPRFTWLAALIAGEMNSTTTAAQRLEAVAGELLAIHRHADLVEIAQDLATLATQRNDLEAARMWRARSLLAERARRRQVRQLEDFREALEGEDFWRSFSCREPGSQVRSALEGVSRGLAARST